MTTRRAPSPARRNTQQKSAIHAVFDETEHPLGPNEVLKAASRKHKGVSIATVYRAIRAMLEEGLLVEVPVPNAAARYEIAGKDHHHHFRCMRCDRLFELGHCDLDVKKILPRGFRLVHHDLFVEGTCADCVA